MLLSCRAHVHGLNFRDEHEGARHTVALTWCVVPDRAAWSGAPTDVLTVPGFGQVWLYAPRAAPSQVVLFVSGDGRWNLGVLPMAETLRDHGALVVGIDIRAFVRTLNAADSCAYPAGDLERLSETIQLGRGLAEYKAPILVGYSSGATLAYAGVGRGAARDLRPRHQSWFLARSRDQPLSVSAEWLDFHQACERPRLQSGAQSPNAETLGERARRPSTAEPNRATI